MEYILEIIGIFLPYDAQHEKKALIPYANSKRPDERAHLCSPIWIFSVRRHILLYHTTYTDSVSGQ